MFNKYKPDLLVYFTDGDGLAPSTAPSGVAVLWVLTGDNPRVPARFGRAVTMRERGERRRLKLPGERG